MSASSAAFKNKEHLGMNRLKIALSELETGDAELFRASLGRLVTRLSHHWEWADLASAEVVIVDMDSLFGHMAWLKAHGAGKQVITFARSGTVAGSDLVLPKPLDDDAFAALLEAAAARIDTSDTALRGAQAAEAHAPKPVAIETPPPSAHEEPANETHLAAAADVAPEPVVVSMPVVAPEPAPEPEPDPVNVAEVLLRRVPPSAMRVQGFDLAIDPEHGAYYCADAALKPLKSALESEPDALRPLEADALAEARQAHKPQSLLRLRWFAGLVATPGLLAYGLREDRKYKLTRWPQTEREFPRHFRIATAMMKQAGTPAEIAQASGVPVAEVIDYINASQAAGWLAVERDEPPPAPELDTAQRGNVLSRFRKPFGR